jgi:hypothetical protein
VAKKMSDFSKDQLRAIHQELESDTDYAAREKVYAKHGISGEQSSRGWWARNGLPNLTIATNKPKGAAKKRSKAEEFVTENDDGDGSAEALRAKMKDIRRKLQKIIVELDVD